MLLLGFGNTIRVDDVGCKGDKTVMRTWRRLRVAVAVASLAGMMAVCSQGAVAGRLQSSTATEQAKKPGSKGKTASYGKTDGSATKPAGSSKAKPGGSSKTTKGKSVGGKGHAASTASRKPTAQTIHLTSAFKAS